MPTSKTAPSNTPSLLDRARATAGTIKPQVEWESVLRDKAHLTRLAALQQAISDAAQDGDATAQACHAASVETMLDKLTAHFAARTSPAPERELE